MTRNKAGSDVDLNRKTLVEGLRTFVAMASCWLDRDAEASGIDAAQEKRLKDVLGLLQCAAAEQREHAELMVATMVRDEVAIALGAKSERLPGGGARSLHRMKHRSRSPSLVPRALTSKSTPYKTDSCGVDDGIGPVLAALRRCHSTWLSRCDNHPQNSRAIRGLGDSEARALAEEALKNVSAGGFEPMKEATRIVAKLTGDLNEQALKRKIRYNDGEKPTARYEILRLEKHYQRALADRHADCVVLGEDVADEGNYFGASRSQEPGHERVKLGELRAWSAAMLIAEACEADVDLADQIFKCRPESYFWEVWSQSTRGYVHRFAINEKAVAYAARRLRRGLAPEAWPPDVAPPNAEEVANLAHDLADTVAGAALVWVEIAANECEAFPAEAAPPSVEAFIGGIADAAMSMFVSTTMNPRRRFQAGWDAASKYLPPEWTAFALLSATEQLDRLGYWPHQRCLDVLQAGAYMPPDDGDPPCQPPI